MMTAPTEAASTAPTLWAVSVVALLASLLTFVLAAPDKALAVALGGALGVANLWAISRIVRGFIGGSGPRLPWSLVAAIKLSALFACVYGLFTLGVPLLWLVAGYGALPVGIVIGQLKQAQLHG